MINEVKLSSPLFVVDHVLRAAGRKWRLLRTTFLITVSSFIANSDQRLCSPKIAAEKQPQILRLLALLVAQDDSEDGTRRLLAGVFFPGP